MNILLLGLCTSCAQDCPENKDGLQITVNTSDQVFKEEISSLEVLITVAQTTRRKVFELGTTLADGETSILVTLPATLSQDGTNNINIRVYAYTGSSLKGQQIAFANNELRLSSCNIITLELVSSPPMNDAGTDAGLPSVEDVGIDAQVDAGPEDAQVDAGSEDAQFDSGIEDAQVDAGFEDASIPDSGIEKTSLLTVTTTGTGIGTIISNPAGISCPGTCSYRFPLNTTVELQATPAPGNGFSTWSGDCEGHNSCELSLTTDSNIETEFELGLVAYYALDGNPDDNSGNGHDGTNMGATLASGIRGVPDTAYLFQSTNKIEVATSTSLSGFSEMTLCTWYSLSTAVSSSERFMIAHSNWGNLTVDDPYLMGVSRSVDAKAFTHFSYDTQSGPEYRKRELTISVVANVWKHFCFVYDGTDAILYLNGQLRQQADFPGRIMQEPNPLVLGNCNAATLMSGTNFRCRSDNSLNGKLDDVKIYQRALSEVEITKEYERR